jgi:hypothetical protein
MKNKYIIELTEPMLGTLTGNKEAATDYILAKNPNGKAADEAEVVDQMESLEKATTYFPSDDKGAFLWDYQVKGFLKEAARTLAITGNYDKDYFKSIGLKQGGQAGISQRFDGLVFVNPRRLYLALPSGTSLGFLERPLRAQTMQGERIALARSQMAPAGTKIEIEIVTLSEKLDEYIEDCLDYGQLRGIGQWRNSGCGRFICRPVQ